MAGLMDELTAIKAVEDKITSNKVANFAYTDTAYQDPATYADGVETYDPNAEQNIPVANASTLKVNATILTKGWRAQASAITRMLMNHFLGRISYNLNKVNDLFSLLLTKLMAYIGQPNGLATLNANGVIPDAQLPAKFVTRINNVAPDNSGDIDVVVGSNTVPITKAFLGAVFGRLLMRKLKFISDEMGYGAKGVVGLSYGKGIWVCGTDDQTGMWWSEDGINWTQGTGLTSYSVSGVMYANGMWVANTTGAGSVNAGLWWSENGKDWIQCTGEITTSGWLDNAGGMWYFRASSSGTWWSEDGKAWTLIQDSPTMLIEAITYANNLWVASSYTTGAWWSEDGKTWTQGTGNITNKSTDDPTYANGMWVVGSTASRWWWSNDGKAWTQGTGGGTNDNYRKAVYAKGIWTAGSTEDGAWYSEDGKAWSQCTGIPNNIDARSNCFYNGVWLFGTIYNGAWYSEDGKAWSQCTGIPTSISARRFYQVNGLLICECTRGQSGTEEGFYWSEDGINWRKTEAPSGTRIITAVYGGGDWICPLMSTSAYVGLYRSSIDDLIEDGTIDLGANIPLVTA